MDRESIKRHLEKNNHVSISKKTYPVQLQSGENFGNVSYQTMLQLRRGRNASSITPKNDEEKTVLKKYSDTILSKTGAVDGNIKAKDYVIHHSYGKSLEAPSYVIEENGQYVVVPMVDNSKGNNSVFLSEEDAKKKYKESGKFFAKFTTQEDAKNYQSTLYNDSPKDVKAPPVSDYIKYTAGKTANAFVGAFADTLDAANIFLHRGGAAIDKGLAYVTSLAGAAPNKVSKWFENDAKATEDYAKRILETGLGAQAKKNSESLDSRYTLNSSIKNTLSGVAETVGTIGGVAAETYLTMGSGLVDKVFKLLSGTGNAIKSYNTANKATKTLYAIKESLKNPTVQNKIVQNLYFGANIGVSTTRDTMDETGDLNKAYQYGDVAAATEVLTESLFGGLAGTHFGEDVLERTAKDIYQKGLKGVGQKVWNHGVTQKALDFIGELAEEGIAGIADPINRRLTGVEPDAQILSLKDFDQTALQTVLSTAVLNLAHIPVTKANIRSYAQALNGSVSALQKVMPDVAMPELLDVSKATLKQVEDRQKVVKKLGEQYESRVKEQDEYMEKVVLGDLESELEQFQGFLVTDEDIDSAENDVKKEQLQLLQIAQRDYMKDMQESISDLRSYLFEGKFSEKIKKESALPASHIDTQTGEFVHVSRNEDGTYSVTMYDGSVKEKSEEIFNARFYPLTQEEKQLVQAARNNVLLRDEDISALSKSLAGTAGKGVTAEQAEADIVSLNNKAVASIAKAVNLNENQSIDGEQVRSANATFLSWPDTLVDVNFVRSYADSFLNGVAQKNNSLYQHLSSVSNDVTGDLVRYIQTGEIPSGYDKQASYALSSYAQNFVQVLQSMATSTYAAKTKFYTEVPMMSRQIEALRKGDIKKALKIATNQALSADAYAKFQGGQVVTLGNGVKAVADPNGYFVFGKAASALAELTGNEPVTMLFGDETVPMLLLNKADAAALFGEEKYPHLYDENKVSQEFLDSVNEEIENAIISIRNGDLSNIPDVIDVAELNEKTIKAISDFVGYNVSGYACKIERDRLVHIENRYGINGEHDQSLSDPKDTARMGYVVNNSDNIEWAIDEKGNRVYDSKYNDRYNKTAPVFVMEKRIDGTYSISQVVPDSKKKTLWITSARIEKAAVGSQVPNADNSPQLTPETPLNSSSAYGNIIVRGNNIVKDSIRDGVENNTVESTDISYVLNGTPTEAELDAIATDVVDTGKIVEMQGNGAYITIVYDTVENVTENMVKSDIIDFYENGVVPDYADIGTIAWDDVRLSIDSRFSSEYDRWVQSGQKYNKKFEIGRTSDALKTIGIPEKRITWDASKIEKIKKKHAINDAIIKQIPYILENPVLIMQSRQKDSRITMLGEVYDLNNKPILAILELEPVNIKGDIILDEIKLASAYGKDNLQKFINQSQIMYVDANKKRTNNWLSHNRLQLPLGQNNHWFNINISQNNTDVKNSIRASSENDTYSNKDKESMTWDDIRLSADGREKGLQEKIKESIEYIKESDELLALDEEAFSKTSEKITEQVSAYFESIGGSVFRKGFGNVILNKKGIKSAIAHGLGRAKCIAFRAVPDVIKYGTQIDYQETWKGRQYSTVVFAGKVKIGEKDAYVGVVVKQNKDTNEYYLHEIVDENGDFIQIKNNEVVPFKTVSKTDNSLHGGTTSVEDNIPQKSDIVKNSIRANSENDTYSNKDEESMTWDDIRLSANGNVLSVNTTNNIMPEDLTEARKQFVDYARKSFPKFVVNKETGKKIGISRTGIDKFLSGNISKEKYASGFKIPELLEGAKKVGEKENLKGKAGIQGYEYYNNVIEIDGRYYATHIRVRNTDMGDKYYGHTISQNIDDIKIEPLAWNSDDKTTGHPINASDSVKDNVSQKSDIVKNSIRANSENDTYGGVENGRNDILSGNLGRTAGKSTGRQGGGVQEISGRSEAESGNRRANRGARRVYGEAVRLSGQAQERRIGRIYGEFVLEEGYTEEMRRVAAQNEARGLKTYFFLGRAGQVVRDGSGRMTVDRDLDFRGAYTDGAVYLRCDDADFSPEQINLHELVHANWNTAEMQAVVKQIANSLTDAEMAYIKNVLYARYAKIYPGNGLAVFEEFVADVLSGMNDYAAQFSDIANTYWNSTQFDVDIYSPATYTESIDAGGVYGNGRSDFQQSTGRVSENSGNSGGRNTGDQRDLSLRVSEGKSEKIDTTVDRERRNTQRSGKTPVERVPGSAKENKVQGGTQTDGERYIQAVKEGGELNGSENPETLGREGTGENNDSVWKRSDDSKGIYVSVGKRKAVLRAGESQGQRFIPWSRELQQYNISTSREKKLAYGLLREISKRRISDVDSTGRVLSQSTKDYFQDTVFKNSEGELIPLFHATDNEFEIFEYGDFGFHVGNMEQAVALGKKYIKEVYVKIINPLYIAEDTMHWPGVVVASKALSQGIISAEDYKQLSGMDGFLEIDYNSPANTAIRELLLEKGYDGIVYNNAIEGEGISAIAFDPNQIKYTSNKAPTVNSNLRFSAVNEERTYPDWAYESLSDEDVAYVEKALFDISIGDIARFVRSGTGEYIIETPDKLVYTDGNYDSPYISKITQFHSVYETEIDDMRRRIYEVEKGKSNVEDATRVIDSTYGEGSTHVITSENYRAYEGIERSTEGRNGPKAARNRSKASRRREHQQSVRDAAKQGLGALEQTIENRGQLKFSASERPYDAKIKYDPRGIKLSKEEYAKFRSSTDTAYYNEGKTHQGLQYQSCVTDKEHVLYIYEDFGFSQYHVVARIDYENEVVANAIIGVLINGEHHRITEAVNSILETFEVRRSGYTVYNAYTKKRSSARSNGVISKRQSKTNTRGADADRSGITGNKRNNIENPSNTGYSVSNGNNSSIRFSAVNGLEEAIDEHVDTTYDYLADPISNIQDDMKDVQMKAELRQGKVYTRQDARQVAASILDHLDVGTGKGISMPAQNKFGLQVLIYRALNANTVPEKGESWMKVARYVAQRAVVQDLQEYFDYDGALQQVRNITTHSFHLTDADKQNLDDTFGESAKGIKSLFGGGERNVTEIYDELCANRPDLFPEDVATKKDRIVKIAEVYQWLKSGGEQKSVRLLDVLETKEDKDAFMRLVRTQIEEAAQVRGRASKVSAERTKMMQRYQMDMERMKSRYEKKIAKLRSTSQAEAISRLAGLNIEPQPYIRPEGLTVASRRYGTLPAGENPVREISVPERIDENRYVSRFARTMMEAGVTPDDAVSEIEKKILDGTMTYEPITDDKAKFEAEKELREDGFARALQRWNDKIDHNDMMEKKDLVLGMMLYNQCVNAKDAKNAMKLAADLARVGTQIGQATQSLRILKQLSPDVQLYHLERIVDRINYDLRRRLKKEYPQISIDEVLAEKCLTAETKEERDAALEELEEHIAAQIPATVRDKVDAWRYFAMLANPRTHVRNMLGNAIFVPAVGMKNFIGAALEKTLPQDQRTKAFVRAEGTREFAREDFEKMYRSLSRSSGGKYSEVMAGIEGKRTIFETKWLEWLRKGNFELLEKMDDVFKKRAYVSSFSGMMTARGYTQQFLTSGTLEANQALEELRNYAWSEAQKATFQEENWFADKLSHAQNMLKNSDKKRGRALGMFMDGLIPFKRTPLNILNQGVTYSPVGAIISGVALRKRVQEGKMTPAQALDDLAKGLSGTILAFLGFLARVLDVVTGAGDEDDKARKWKEAQGFQNYAVNIGGHSYTIDWTAPASLPFFVGVEIANLFAEREEIPLSKVVDAATRITDPIMELSFLQGLNSAIRSAVYGETTTLSGLAMDVTLSYFGQFIPTFFGQVARTVDKTRRTVYNDKNSPWPKVFDSLVQEVQMKIPFASFALQPKLDVWGREMDYGDTVAERVFGNFISPGYLRDIDSTFVDKELERLYGQLGDNRILPSNPAKYFIEDGVRHDLTGSQYTKYSKIKGQEALTNLDSLFKTSAYKNASDEEKADAISKVFDNARIKAMNTILRDMDKKTWYTGISQTSTGVLEAVQDNEAYNKVVANLEPTGKNSLEYEKSAMLSSYIDSASEIILKLPEGEQKKAGDALVQAVKALKTQYTVDDTLAEELGTKPLKHVFGQSSMPEPDISYTKNKVKYEYTLTPSQYNDYVFEVMEAIEEGRDKVRRTYAYKKASAEQRASLLKESDSEAKSEIKKKYQKKYARRRK